MEPPPTMLINHVFVEAREIVVGATTRRRWGWEIDDGRAHGGEAKTLVTVALVDHGEGRAVGEEIGLFVVRGDPERAPALAVIGALLDAAWEIRERGWNTEAARDACMGRVVRGASHDRAVGDGLDDPG